MANNPIRFFGSNSVLQDWIPYTPVFTGVGSVTNNVAWYRRVGNSIEVQGTYTPGSASATPWSITLPKTIDVATMPSGSGGAICGLYNQTATGGAPALLFSGNYASEIFYDGSTSNLLFCANRVDSGALEKSDANLFIGAGQPQSYTFKYSISLD